MCTYSVYMYLHVLKSTLNLDRHSRLVSIDSELYCDTALRAIMTFQYPPPPKKKKKKKKKKNRIVSP